MRISIIEGDAGHLDLKNSWDKYEWYVDLFELKKDHIYDNGVGYLVWDVSSISNDDDDLYDKIKVKLGQTYPEDIDPYDEIEMFIEYIYDNAVRWVEVG
jgi:hypothetical protein